MLISGEQLPRETARHSTSKVGLFYQAFIASVQQSD